MNTTPRLLSAFLAISLFASCGALTKGNNDSFTSKQTFDFSKLPGYWKFTKVTVNGSTEIGGEEIIKGLEQRMFIVKNNTWSEYNITRRSYSPCLKDIPYKTEGISIGLVETKNADGSCGGRYYTLSEFTDKKMVVVGWVTVFGTKYDSLHTFEKISDEEGLKLVSKDTQTAPKP